jgi:hypothetical protein
MILPYGDVAVVDIIRTFSCYKNNYYYLLLLLLLLFLLHVCVNERVLGPAIVLVCLNFRFSDGFVSNMCVLLHCIAPRTKLLF